MRYRVLILGGYGVFGARIARRLARDPHIELVIAGRRPHAATAFTDKLQREIPAAAVYPVRLDIHAGRFALQLQALHPNLVIHTCGPFQVQDYVVAETCIELGIHYVDLADSRQFVTGFRSLDNKARARGVLAVSGASSVPGLSSAVIDHYLPAFRSLHSVAHGISPGNRAPRGLATVTAILGYAGKPLTQLHRGHWITVYGWQGLHKHGFPAPLGKRWMSYCDVPDLELFPQRYPDLHSVSFSAGLELGLLHLGIWTLSWLVRTRLIGNLGNHARLMQGMSRWFEGMGSDSGGMYVSLSGLDSSSQRIHYHWHLRADRGAGPQIPATPAVILARKLARGELNHRGAHACMGLFTLDEFMRELRDFDIHQRVVINSADRAALMR